MERYCAMADEQKPGQDEQKPSLLSNILAIVGFIILIVIIIWGLIHLASLSSGWFSGLFSKSNTVKVSAPADVTAGQLFPLTWTYSPKEAGSYVFLYQCKDGAQFGTPGAQENTINIIPCGAAFGLPAGQTTLPLMPILQGDASIAMPLTITFAPNATSSKPVQGGVTVTVHKGASQPTPQPATSTPQEPQQHTGPADLMVRLISVNVDAGGTGTFVFDISNVGASATGPYYFQATLPTQNGYIYSSPVQSSMGPGDHVVNTLTFSAAISGTASVAVDPTNSIAEASENNNYASQYVSAPYYYNNSYDYNYNYNYYDPNYYQPYNYPQYQYPYYGY